MTPEDQERSHALRTVQLHAHLADHASNYNLRNGAARDLAVRLADVFKLSTDGRTWQGPTGETIADHLAMHDYSRHAEHLFNMPDAADGTAAPAVQAPKKPRPSPALAKLSPAQRSALTPTEKLDIANGPSLVTL